MSAFTLSASHAVAKTAGLRAKTQVRTPRTLGRCPETPTRPAQDRSPEEECRNDAVPLVTPIEEGPTNRAPTEADRRPEFRSNP